MKAEILIPTVQYGNIRFFVEGNTEEIIEESKRLNKLYLGGFGHDDKSWNKILDKYLAGGSMSPDDSENMDDRQKWMIHEIDKSVSRQNYVNSKGQPHHSLETL